MRRRGLNVAKDNLPVSKLHSYYMKFTVSNSEVYIASTGKSSLAALGAPPLHAWTTWPAMHVGTNSITHYHLMHANPVKGQLVGGAKPRIYREGLGHMGEVNNGVSLVMNIYS